MHFSDPRLPCHLQQFQNAHRKIADELVHYFRFDAAPIPKEERNEKRAIYRRCVIEPIALVESEHVIIAWISWSLLLLDLCCRVQQLFGWLKIIIPVASVSVERVFSKSRHICSALRSSLKENTIRMALLTKTWIRNSLFEMVLNKVLRQKHSDNGQKKSRSNQCIKRI